MVESSKSEKKMVTRLLDHQPSQSCLSRYPHWPKTSSFSEQSNILPLGPSKNAVEGAGFDEVEFHSAMGFIPDQFLQDASNQRTDNYGRSVEDRSRFRLEAINAIVKAVGQERISIMSEKLRSEYMHRHEHIYTYQSISFLAG
ncbi:hypothetical protein CVT25_000621 [Psilocybe cyanescens]|uniref:NADH:flavin oxidoreductase/NADH oxidase N-terminal domain-containing protein n=1 Tax=Psilocybe cyanescens TaxID=93625 RepID=A0A409XWD0_PSICY|nr:hypothetical protein CVT25_000621 [Psilocybe cyanescens]